MKKYLLGFFALSMLTGGMFFTFSAGVLAQDRSTQDAWPVEPRSIEVPVSPEASSSLVISQLYGGGGNPGAVYRNDFVEIFNRGGSPISLSGWSIQYASASGTNWLVTPLPSVTIQSGQYFLIQFDSSGAVGASLPTPDFIAPFAQGQGFITNLSATTGGKLALANSTTQLPAVSCPTGSPIVDFVGYGAANCSETTAVPATTNSTGAIRGGNGCADTDVNSADFTVVTPAPRNGATALNSCGIAGTLSASGGASPNSVAPGALSQLTVTVSPATTPPSTGIGVTVNLTAFGGSATETMFDDGVTSGDAVAGDNVFSYLLAIPAGVGTGTYNFPISVTDQQSHTAGTTIGITVTVPPDPNTSEHLVMGNPSNAVTDVNSPTNYLMVKTQYALSYHRDNGKPNWVGWHLSTTWLGSTSRQDDFRNDPSLPAGWYQVQGSDYSGNVNNGGFDRGHHTPSGDRTSSVPDNSATFFMTNMMPQAPDNNQGPWAVFEDYCRTLVTQASHQELYIYTGSVGQGGTGLNGFANTVANGHVVVPAYTWKVVMVLPDQSGNDLARVSAATRTIAIIMPNKQGIRSDAWQKYLATVDQVEALTGYDFYSNVPVATQAVFESTLDAASNISPQSVNAGTYTNLNIDGPNTTLNGDITVNGVLTLGGSTLNTNGHTITFGPSASVSRISGMINGQTAKQFTSVSSFTFPVGTAPFEYSPVTLNLTALAVNPSTLTVTPHNTTHPSSPDPAFTLKRFWTLSETGDLTGNLIFKYVDTDIPVGVVESSLALHRYETSFAVVDGALLNTTANTVTTTTPITDFSDWTLMRPLAPATNLTVTGRVLISRGGSIGARNALVTFVDQQTNAVRTTLTDASGNYSFDNITGGTTFNASVSARGQIFPPRVIQVFSSLTNENFVGQRR